MRGRGEEVTTAEEDPYCAEKLRPKCVELQRMCQQYKDLLRRRRSLLLQSRHLHHTLDCAHQWCSQGVDLLASQPIDRCQTAQGAEESLTEIDHYLRTFRQLRLSDPAQELKSSFGEVLTPESRTAVQQVLQRVEDVQAMCEKRKHSLRRMCRHPPSSPAPPHPHPHPHAHPVPAAAPEPPSSSHHHHHHHHPHPSAFPPHPQHPHAHQVDSPVHLRRKGSAADALEMRSPLSRDKGVRRRPSDSQLPSSTASIISHPHHHHHHHPHLHLHHHHPHHHHDLLIAGGCSSSSNNNSNSNCISSSSSSNSSSGVSSKTSSIAASDASSGDLGLPSAPDNSGTSGTGGGGGGSGSGSGSGGGDGCGDGAGQRDSLSSSSVASLPEMDVLQAKRRHVMTELIETEKTYVTELQEILWGYCKELDSRALQHIVPEELVGQKHILFGNLEQICKFHAETFLRELQECRDYPAKVGRCFVKRKEEFQMYSVYCQNKPKSEALRMRVGDSNPFFKECQHKLGHKLPLGAYLLKPVQRITKYQLLLKEMLRFTGEDVELEQQLQEALDTMLSVLQYLNASMHQVHIVGYQDNLLDLGRLLLHGGFSVWTEHKRERIKDLRFKPMQRHIFLYERGLLLCKKKEDVHEEPIYTFKNKLKLSQVGLTEKLKGDKRKFELWSRGREEVYIIQAPTLQVKDVWVKEIKRVLMNQFDQIRSHHKMYVPLSQDESSVSSQLSSDSSDYSLDSWRTSGGGNTTTTTTTTPPTHPPSTSTSTPTPTPTGTPTPTPTQTSAPCNIPYNSNSNNNQHHYHQHHHHHQPSTTSTLPVGLEMISPLTPPSSATTTSAFPHSPPSAPPPPFPPRPQSRGRRVGARGEVEGVEQWSSGELSSHGEEDEEEEEESDEQGALLTAVEPSYQQPFVSLGHYEAVDSSELGMVEGDAVAVLRVGGHGWWYARHLASGAEGWVPSTFLHPLLPPAPHPPIPPPPLLSQGAQPTSMDNSSSGVNI